MGDRLLVDVKGEFSCANFRIFVDTFGEEVLFLGEFSWTFLGEFSWTFWVYFLGHLFNSNNLTLT